ncbi:DJ-1 family protein [Planctomycetales bacterium]|nr:DJ-1 family protein [Planctomycetales bacterium]
MTKTIIVPLAEGFEEIEAITPIDVLRRAGFNVVTVDLDDSSKLERVVDKAFNIGTFLSGFAAPKRDRSVTGSHNIVITPDMSLGEVGDFTPDALVLPGGMPGAKNLGEHSGLKKLAERVAESGGLLAAICAAPAWTLGNWGLLAGHKATCFPGCESMFPNDVRYQDAAVVIDDTAKNKIITAKGAGAAMDFALAIVETFSGSQAAVDLKAKLQY